MKEITREQLEELYINQNKSLKEVKNILGINIHALMKLIEEYKIEKSKELIREQRRNTNRIKYGVDHPSQHKEVQEKTKETNRKIYGCDHHILADQVQKKVKKTNLEKYGTENFLQSEIGRSKVQETCLEKYGSVTPFGNSEVREKVNKALNSKETKDKRINTQKLNNNYNTSKPEEQVYELLVEKFGKEDVLRQHKTELYPFACDFYIKSKDLYIELQGSWTHGRQPYNQENPLHQKIVEKWLSKNTEYFSYAAKVWTTKDPAKRKIAKENNLNWKEFFTIEDLKAEVIDETTNS